MSKSGFERNAKSRILVSDNERKNHSTLDSKSKKKSIYHENLMKNASDQIKTNGGADLKYLLGFVHEHQ